MAAPSRGATLIRGMALVAGPSRSGAEEVLYVEQSEPPKDKEAWAEGRDGALGKTSTPWHYPLLEAKILRLNFMF